MRGLGYAHAHDRLVQMLLQRTVGKGLLSTLNPSEDAFKIDQMFKKMNFAGK